MREDYGQSQAWGNLESSSDCGVSDHKLNEHLKRCGFDDANGGLDEVDGGYDEDYGSFADVDDGFDEVNGGFDELDGGFDEVNGGQEWSNGLSRDGSTLQYDFRCFGSHVVY